MMLAVLYQPFSSPAWTPQTTTANPRDPGRPPYTQQLPRFAETHNPRHVVAMKHILAEGLDLRLQPLPTGLRNKHLGSADRHPCRSGSIPHPSPPRCHNAQTSCARPRHAVLSTSVPSISLSSTFAIISPGILRFPNFTARLANESAATPPPAKFLNIHKTNREESHPYPFFCMRPRIAQWGSK
jgi:hypothetical protein